MSNISALHITTLLLLYKKAKRRSDYINGMDTKTIDNMESLGT